MCSQLPGEISFVCSANYRTTNTSMAPIHFYHSSLHSSKNLTASPALQKRTAQKKHKTQFTTGQSQWSWGSSCFMLHSRRLRFAACNSELGFVIVNRVASEQIALVESSTATHKIWRLNQWEHTGLWLVRAHREENPSSNISEILCSAELVEPENMMPTTTAVTSTAP